MFRTLHNMGTMKQLLSAAERESLADGDPDPGAEHVVLAALGMADGTAQRAFATLGGSADRLREAIAAHHRDALADVGFPDPPPATPAGEEGRGLMRAKGSTRELLKVMATQAKQVHPDRFVSAHVLLAASSFEFGTLSEALTSMGISREDLRRAALAELT